MHRYTPYPSVTQVLDYFFGDWKKHVDPDMLKAAAKRGSDIHNEIAKLIVRDPIEPFPFTSSNEAIRAVNYYHKYEKQLGEIKLIEERLISDTLSLSGKPDLVTAYAVIDWKTGKINKKLARLQMAGYSLLLRELGIVVAAWIVYDVTKGRAYNVYDRKAEKEFKKLLKKYREEAYEY